VQELSLDLNERRADTMAMPATAPASLFLRHATSADTRAVAYLSELDESERLADPVLMAFDGERPLAALSLADGRAVADPFARTADAVALLRLRARQGRSSVPSRRLGFGRLGLAA
jgi:hypothetical protein